MIAYQLSVLPKTADPEGSTRYENINIILEEIPDDFIDVTFYDDLEHSRFIIEEHHMDFKEYRARMFKGTVIKEANGNYGWWRNLL